MAVVEKIVYWIHILTIPIYQNTFILSSDILDKQDYIRVTFVYIEWLNQSDYVTAVHSVTREWTLSLHAILQNMVAQ